MNGFTLVINPSVAPNVIKNSVVGIIRTHTRKHARLVHVSERKRVLIAKVCACAKTKTKTKTKTKSLVRSGTYA